MSIKEVNEIVVPKAKSDSEKSLMPSWFDKEKQNKRYECMQKLEDCMEQILEPLWEAFERAGKVQEVGGNPLMRVNVESIVSIAIERINHIKRMNSLHLAQAGRGKPSPS